LSPTTIQKQYSSAYIIEASVNESKWSLTAKYIITNVKVHLHKNKSNLFKLMVHNHNEFKYP
jgi:hypothetical protein